MKKLSKIIIPLIIAGVSYFLFNNLGEKDYPDKWIKKYHNQVFSLEENRENVVDSLCLDVDGDGIEDGIFYSFDLKKRFWGKPGIEAVGYFRYPYFDSWPTQDNANLFYTVEDGNLESIIGGLRDNNPDDKLNKRLNSLEVEKLLKLYKENAIKGIKVRKKLEENWKEERKLLNPLKKI
jgi:hypothetical protein